MTSLFTFSLFLQNFIFPYSSLLSLYFLLCTGIHTYSIALNFCHTDAQTLFFSVFLLHLSSCRFPTLCVRSLSLTRKQLYALHMVAAAVVLISSGSNIFFGAWEQFLDTLSNLNFRNIFAKAKYLLFLKT